jgi:hypothetical protein
MGHPSLPLTQLGVSLRICPPTEQYTLVESIAMPSAPLTLLASVTAALPAL